MWRDGKRYFMWIEIKRKLGQQYPHQTKQIWKRLTRDKEEHDIIINGSIQQEDITLINIYVPNIGALKYIKQILIDTKERIKSNKIIVGDFNMP